MRKIFFAALLVCLAPAALRAEDEPEGRRSVGFSSSTGLVGMRDMIDARVPSLLNVRGTLKFHHESTNLDSRSTFYSVDEYSADVIAGVSALGLLDAGLRLPMTVRTVRVAIHGGPDRTRQDEGWSDLELSGKVGFQLGPWIALGPYMTVQANTGSKLLDKKNVLHIGAAGTASILDDRIGLHVNLTNVTFSGGKWAIGYRAGVSLVPVANDTIVLRLFCYLDGKDYIGQKIRGNDARLFGGVQTLFFKVVTAEISFGMKFFAGDARHLHIQDDATYGLDIGAGVSFMF